MIVAGIASVPNRLEQLINTIDSLVHQVDLIRVSLNNYTAIPIELNKWGNIIPELTQGTDEQKFRKVEGDIFISCDDDLIYPVGYVATCLEKLDKWNCFANDKIISFHGRRFPEFPIDSYYRTKASKYRCLDDVSSDIQVHTGGTGCMAFYVEDFKLSLKDFPYPYMADIQLAIAAKKQSKKIVCCSHKSGWIKYQDVPNTIYDRFKNDDKLQTTLLNSLYA